MPFRLNEFRAKIQFTTSAEMPALIYKAVLASGKVSNTEYIQHAVCEALARDLDMPLQRLLDNLPPARGKAAHPFGPNRKPAPVRIGPSGGWEEVR